MAQFINISGFITIKLNIPTDVPCQMMVGGAFVYMCENLVEVAIRYNAGFFPYGSLHGQHYNEVPVYIV